MAKYKTKEQQNSELGGSIHTIQSRNVLRREIEKQTEDFLKRGGKIDKVPIQKRETNSFKSTKAGILTDHGSKHDHKMGDGL